MNEFINYHHQFGMYMDELNWVWQVLNQFVLSYLYWHNHMIGSVYQDKTLLFRVSFSYHFFFFFSLLESNYSMPKTLSFIDINETYLIDSISKLFLLWSSPNSGQLLQLNSFKPLVKASREVLSQLRSSIHLKTKKQNN